MDTGRLLVLLGFFFQLGKLSGQCAEAGALGPAWCLKESCNTCHQVELGVEVGVTFRSIANKNLLLNQTSVMAKPTLVTFLDMCMYQDSVWTPSQLPQVPGGCQHLHSNLECSGDNLVSLSP